MSKKWMFATILILLETLAMPIAGLGQALTNYETGGKYQATAYDGYSMTLRSTFASGANTVTVYPCYVQTRGFGGKQFTPLFVGNKLTVTDGSSETVAITAVSTSNPGSVDSPGCTFTATFSSAHNSGVRLSSGTNGLLEAINDAHQSGGQVVIDPQWGGTTAMITGASLVYHNVSIEDYRSGITQRYNAGPNIATVMAAPATLTAVTVGFALNGANATGGTYTGASTYHYAIAYVDALGNIGPASADFSAATAGSGTTNQIGFKAPAASTGAVGYVMYISLAAGSYALSYKVPISSAVCAMTTIETVTAACAVTNATYGQTGSAAIVSALTVNTARLFIGKGETSSTTDYVGNSNARTVSAYIPAGNASIPGVVHASLPFTAAAATATTVPGVIGTLHFPAGFMNTIGKTIRVCGFATEAANGSAATIQKIQFFWDADGSNVAGVPVVLSTSAITATLVTTNADQWTFCQNFKTTAKDDGTAIGSLQAGTGFLTSSYGAVGTVATSAPVVGAATVGSLNLAGEGQLHVVWLHTTGTDAAGVQLQDLTVEVLN